MPANIRLFVEDRQPQLRIAVQKLATDRQAENAGADDHDVIATHKRNVSIAADGPRDVV